MIWPYSRGESEDEDEREGRRQEAAPPQGEAFHGGAAGGLSGAFAADRERIGGGRGDRDASGLHREKAPARSRVRPRLRGGRGGGRADAAGSADKGEPDPRGAGFETGGELPAPPQRFDPDLAFRFLKWRELKRRGTAPPRGRVAAGPSIEEAGDEIVRRVAAIRRHREKEQ